MKRNNLFLGVFFVFLGVFFLLNNLNIINFSVWTAMIDLWPLLLVIFGVHLISNKPIIQVISWIIFFGAIILYSVFKQDSGAQFNIYNFKGFF